MLPAGGAQVFILRSLRRSGTRPSVVFGFTAVPDEPQAAVESSSELAAALADLEDLDLVFQRRRRNAKLACVLSLVALRYLDETGLTARLKSFVRCAIPSAAIFMPIAFFLSVLRPDATEPNGLIALALCRCRSAFGRRRRARCRAIRKPTPTG